jgi:two-component system CheB/CheR fusion protein
VQPFVDEKKQRLYVHQPQEAFYVSGDVDRLQQAQVNLLVNASRYSPNGGRIDYQIVAEEDEILIAVRDEGEGISPSLMGQIFEPFVQADQAIDRPRGGMGLGLPLVKLIVEAHGGSVAAFSAGQNRGSEFTIRLPRSAPPREAEIAAESIQMRCNKLLLVEDNAAIAKMLQRTLEIKGFEVATASDGREALRIIHSLLPDVAVIDIGLPDMDGYEVARQLRENPAWNGLMLVALTGYGRDSDREKSRRAGFDLHLVKPLDPDELLRAIQQQTAAPR